MSDYEPDFDDGNSMMAEDEPNGAPPDFDIPYDDDDLCPDCGEPDDFCVCNTDDELDEFDQVGILLLLEDGSMAHALVSPDVDPKTVEALTDLANAAATAIRRGDFDQPDDDSGFDGLTLCPRCHGAETRHGALCLVCQNELRDDQS